MPFRSGLADQLASLTKGLDEVSVTRLLTYLRKEWMFRYSCFVLEVFFHVSGNVINDQIYFQDFCVHFVNVQNTKVTAGNVGFSSINIYSRQMNFNRILKTNKCFKFFSGSSLPFYIRNNSNTIFVSHYFPYQMSAFLDLKNPPNNEMKQCWISYIKRKTRLKNNTLCRASMPYLVDKVANSW